MAAMFDLAGWTDAMPALEAAAAQLPPLEACLIRSMRPEEAISSPEAMDPKTDSFCSMFTPLSELIKKKLVTDAATMTDAATVDAMDHLLVNEWATLDGVPVTSALFTCIYFHRPSLAAGNAPLAAFVEAGFKVVHLSQLAVYSGECREGEEEFPTFPCEEPVSSKTVDEVSEIIDAAVAGCKNAAIVQRLRFQQELITLLDQMIGLRQNGAEGVAGVRAKVAAAAAALAALDRAAGAAIAVDGGIFSDQAAVWTSSTPLPKYTVAGWAETKASFVAMFKWCTAVCDFENVATATALLNAVKAFSQQKPALVVRSFAFAFLYNDGRGVMMGKLSLPDLILDELDAVCGAPVYKLVADGERATVSAVVNFRIPASKMGQLTPDLRAVVEKQTVDAMRKWASDCARVFITLMHAYLHNRGRCHRRLVNALAAVAQLQHASWDMDQSCFCCPVAGGQPDKVAELSSRNAVLTAFASELALATMDDILNLVVELDLLSKPEYLSVLFYRNFHNGTRHDNLNILHAPFATVSAIELLAQEHKEAAKKRPVLPPAASTRRATALPALSASSDVARHVANASYVMCAALEPFIPSMAQLESSLQSTQCVFDHRFLEFGRVQRPTYVPYTETRRQLAAFTKDRAHSVTQAVGINKAALKKIADLKKDPSFEFTAFLAAAEAATKQNIVKLGMVAAAMAKKEDLAAAFTLDISCPQDPSFVVLDLKML
jgi:hypothetical protein